ncbi:MAG: hypothetical protein ACKO0W_01530 [Planctomycetota bacterium]
MRFETEKGMRAQWSVAGEEARHPGRLEKARDALLAIEGVLREELGQEDAMAVAAAARAQRDDVAAAERLRPEHGTASWSDVQSGKAASGLEFVPDIPRSDSTSVRQLEGRCVASRTQRGIRAGAGSASTQSRASRIARAAREAECFVRNPTSGLRCDEPPMDAVRRAAGRLRSCVPLDGSVCDEVLGGGLRRGAVHCVAGVSLGREGSGPQHARATWMPPVGALLHMVRRAVAQSLHGAPHSARPSAILWIGRSIWPDSRSFFGESDALSERVHRRSIFVCGEGERDARSMRAGAGRGASARSARACEAAWAAEQAIRLAAADIIVVDGRSFDDLVWRRLHLAAAEAEHEPLVLVAVPPEPGMSDDRDPAGACERGRALGNAVVRCPAATRWLVVPEAPRVDTPRVDTPRMDAPRTDDDASASSRPERDSMPVWPMRAHPGWILRLVSVRRGAGTGLSPEASARIEAGEIALSCGVLRGMEPCFPEGVGFGAAAPPHDGPGCDADEELHRLLAQLDAVGPRRPDDQVRCMQPGSLHGLQHALQHALQDESQLWRRWFACSA